MNGHPLIGSGDGLHESETTLTPDTAAGTPFTRTVLLPLPMVPLIGVISSGQVTPSTQVIASPTLAIGRPTTLTLALPSATLQMNPTELPTRTALPAACAGAAAIKCRVHRFEHFRMLSHA